jgi:hypothetical protein
MKKWQTGLNVEEPEQQSAGYFQVSKKQQPPVSCNFLLEAPK